MSVTTPNYPEEILDEDDDNGTMPASLEKLRKAVFGHKIVSVETKKNSNRYSDDATIITLDNGKQVKLVGGSDCCAHTHIRDFLFHPELVNHAVLGVGTTDGYTTWHIYADLGDILQLNVGWSAGNAFYYGYGFDITVEDLPE